MGEKYVCNLSAELKEHLKTHMKETDSVREQSLVTFRSWVEKQPYVKNVPTDDKFLVLFLREGHYSMIEAQNILLHFLSLKSCFTRWFSNVNPMDPAIDTILKGGTFFPLHKKDVNKRTVVFGIARNIDIKSDPIDQFRAAFTAFETMSLNEENQIRGYTIVADLGNFGAQYLSVYTPKLIYDFINTFLNIGVIRLEQVHIFNLSGPFAAIANTVKGFLSEEFQKKFILTSDDSIHSDIPRDILPKEYRGGCSTTVKEFVADFSKERAKHGDLHTHLAKTVVVDTKWQQQRVKDLTGTVMGVEGNFRKLEID